MGKVQDIFIPGKRDKQGKRFGFVRFSSQSNTDVILSRLNQMWIGSYIIRAYTPRYQRPSELLSSRVRSTATKETLKSISQGPISTKLKTQGTSYLDSLLGRVGNAAAEREKEPTLQFQSEDGEREWLRHAFTGRLKDTFSWKDHSEELQQECGGKLVLTNMGNQMILIQSATEETTDKMLTGFDEWSKFWMDWCKPWSSIDVNQYRSVWTRWIGIPLHAWSLRFFRLCSSRFGRLEELHDVTLIKSRLDEAYVKVSTGLASIDRIMQCNIDGASFQIRVEEIRCMESINHLKIMEDSASETDSDTSEEREWSGGAPAPAMMGTCSDFDDDDVESVQGGLADCSSPQPISRMAATPPSGNERLARCNNEVVPIQIVASLDVEPTGLPLRVLELNDGGPITLGATATCISSGPKENQVGLGEIGPNPHPDISIAGPSAPLVGSNINIPSPTEPTSLHLSASPNQVHPSIINNRSTPQNPAPRERGKNRKSQRKPHDPNEWKDFINPMASAGELNSIHKKKARGVRRTDGPVDGSDLNPKRAAGWEFGKQLGLTSRKSDAEMEKLLQGEEKKEFGLGARGGFDK